MPWTALAAPAKINLFLHVTGRRADGYHTLRSLIAFADVADLVTVETAAGGRFTLEVEGPFAPALAGDDPQQNLVLRAARALAVHAAPGAGASIRLTKNIPVAAGLGGGSADAAAVLVALEGLWDTRPGELAALALSLGADVPVCLRAAPALVAGIGEEIAPVPPLPPAGLVLVNPGVAVETRAVFAAADRTPARFGAGAPTPAGPFADAAALADALAATGNDLDPPARALAPVIGEVLAALGAMEDCRLARMSGSGATCFGLFDDIEGAMRAADRLRDAAPGWWVWAGGFARPR